MYATNESNWIARERIDSIMSTNERSLSLLGICKSIAGLGRGRQETGHLYQIQASCVTLANQYTASTSELYKETRWFHRHSTWVSCKLRPGDASINTESRYKLGPGCNTRRRNSLPASRSTRKAALTRGMTQWYLYTVVLRSDVQVCRHPPAHV